MYLTNYAYGKLRVEKSEELYTGANPKTSLVWKDLDGASVKGDDGTGFLLLFNKGTKLFLIGRDGSVRTGIFKELNEEDGLMLEDGRAFVIDRLVFIGECNEV